MRNTLISPAVFAYTLYVKFEDWKLLAILIFFMLMPSFSLCATMIIPHPALTMEMQKEFANFIVRFFATPLVGLITCYLFVSDGPSGLKLIAESDSLALLFTRPLTRFSYVLSKYLAGAIGTTIALSFGLIVTSLVGLCVGINGIELNLLAFSNIFCNALSWAALVVFLHSARPLVAIITYLFLNGAASAGSAYTRAEEPVGLFLQMVKEASLFINKWFGDLLPGTINLQALTSFGSFDTYEATIFISNITLFLMFATFALARRELSYGSD